jgi:magnesium chelatase family protein
MVGPPGAGKTLMARALPSILPPMSINEALDVTRVYSVADMLPNGMPLVRQRPFRAPHHTISNAGLVGGGHWPRPGEISLAHRGVLFLDELPEFGTRVLSGTGPCSVTSRQVDSTNNIPAANVIQAIMVDLRLLLLLIMR